MAKKSPKKEKNKSAEKLPDTQLHVQDYIEPLLMNGLQGRMLRMPANNGKNSEILLVYGHHSTLERWWGVIQDLNQYGSVTVPDLPGFGGMQSFYKIGEKPDIDTLADYLAAFVKLRYKRRKVTIFGLSFGFVVVTRMLQKYPDIAKKVNLLISVVGFARHDEFTFSKPRMLFYKSATKIFSYKIPALWFRMFALHPVVIRNAYARTFNAKKKFKSAGEKDFNDLMDFEIHLWHSNDVRTHMHTSNEFLKLDNCNRQVDLPLWHIAVKKDRYFDNDIVEQHLNVIFSKVKVAYSTMDDHAPSVIATAEEAAPILPAKIRKELEKL